MIRSSSPSPVRKNAFLNVAYGFLLIFLFGTLSHEAVAGDSSDSIDSTIEAARQAAHDNDNAKSAQLFSRAVAEAPERRGALLLELSEQLTYSGNAAKAIPLYHEVLESRRLQSAEERRAKLGLALALSWNHRLSKALAMYHGLLGQNPRDVDALLGHARVLSWQDQLTPAMREYKHVLALDPGNLEARESIARLQTWRGRQRTAQRLARAILKDHPGDLQASEVLAQSELWMGRPDIAQRDDREILAAHPNDSGARSFASDIADALNPALRVSESVGTQSDNLLIRTANFETEVHSAQGLTSFLFDYQPISYVAPNTDYATERRLGVGVRQRFNDWSEINANVANDGISAMGISDKSLFLYNTYLTLWPNDTFRFDIGSHRDTFDNLTSLREGITAVFDSFSMDVLPDEISRLTLRADRGQFSDGNERAWQQVEFERAFVRQPRILFGAQYTNYTFTQSLYNGYFDPPHYRSAEVTTHIYGDSRKRLYYDLSGSYGREWVEAGGDRPTHSLNGSLSYVLSRPLSISAFYNSFDTRQFSNGGFARTVVGLRLQTKW